MAWDRLTLHVGSIKLGSTTEEYSRTHQWQGEGNDWIKLMAQQQPRKEDVVHSLLVSMRQAVEEKTKTSETRPARKKRELPPLELEVPEEGKKMTLEIKGDSKNDPGLGQRSRQVEKRGNLLLEWWSRGVELPQRTADWAAQMFREHNKEDCQRREGS